VTGIARDQAVDLGWTLGVGVAAVALGVVGLAVARRGLATGTTTAAAGLGLGVVGGGVAGFLLGVLHLFDASGDWLFDDVQF
jgi:hypothetical protein